MSDSQTARAYWTTGPSAGELRAEPLREPADGECLVRTLATGISCGTERLVHAGLVPASIAADMRAPFQAGEFPSPVKYGYLAVGVVERGPDALLGRRVFALHPHQDRFVITADDLLAIPDSVPTDRALLAGAVETALNGLWDAAPLIGDRLAVVGGGLIGSCVALLASQLPLGRLAIIEPDARRRATLISLGLDAVAAPDAPSWDGAFDVVLHCSATASGLNTGLRLLGAEGVLVELSWYGTQAPTVELGGAFHAKRLTIIASQVGQVSPRHRARWTSRDRLTLALDHLTDARFDRLLGRSVPFTELPQALDALAAGADLGPLPIVRYEED